MVQEMLGSMSQHMDIEAIVRAMGVTQCTKVRSFNVKAVTKALEEMKAQSGVRVLITEEPCVLYARRQLKKAQPQVAEVAQQGRKPYAALSSWPAPPFTARATILLWTPRSARAAWSVCRLRLRPSRRGSGREIL